MVVDRPSRRANVAGPRTTPVRPAGDFRVDRPEAVVSVEQRCQALGFEGVDAEHHAGLAPRFLHRVTHIARHWRRRIRAQSVHGPPAIPSPLQCAGGPLRAVHQVRITHCEYLPSKRRTFRLPRPGPPRDAACFTGRYRVRMR